MPLTVSPALEIWVGLKRLKMIIPLIVPCYSVYETLPSLTAFFNSPNSFEGPDHLFDPFLTVLQLTLSPLSFIFL